MLPSTAASSKANRRHNLNSFCSEDIFVLEASPISCLHTVSAKLFQQNLGSLITPFQDLSWGGAPASICIMHSVFAEPTPINSSSFGAGKGLVYVNISMIIITTMYVRDNFNCQFLIQL